MHIIYTSSIASYSYYMASIFGIISTLVGKWMALE